MSREMTCYQRVMTAFNHQEADRVPVFLFLTVHGAKELGMTPREYYARAENIVEGQLRLWRKFGHDCVCGFTYGAQEAAAFGADTIFYDDGPPNVAGPVIHHPEEIDRLTPPVPTQVPVLQESLRAIEMLAAKVKGQVPIIGAVIAPFSLPVMLLGFQGWLDLLLFGEPARRQRLLQVTADCCVAWANAQLAAGVDALGYFDPVASTTIVTREQFIAHDLDLARQTIARIRGPVAFAGAGGRFSPIIDLIPQTGAAAVMLSANDDLAAIKAQVGGQISLLGNLNNVAMIDWTPAQAEAEVRRCLEAAARGGGYVLSDQHGELPWAVEDEVIAAIVATVRKWGRYR